MSGPVHYNAQQWSYGAPTVLLEAVAPRRHSTPESEIPPFSLPTKARRPRSRPSRRRSPLLPCQRRRRHYSRSTASPAESKKATNACKINHCVSNISMQRCLDAAMLASIRTPFLREVELVRDGEFWPVPSSCLLNKAVNVCTLSAPLLIERDASTASIEPEGAYHGR